MFSILPVFNHLCRLFRNWKASHLECARHQFHKPGVGFIDLGENVKILINMLLLWNVTKNNYKRRLESSEIWYTLNTVN